MTEDTWKGCTPDDRPPVVGEEYRIIHSRKGVFYGVVESADEDGWAKVRITDGVAKAVMSYNVKYEDETANVRSSLCRMDPVSGFKDAARAEEAGAAR